MEEPGQYLAQELSSDLIDAMRYAALSDSFLTHQLNESCEPQATQLSTNKESEMNELMLALEAMITRIVREQIAEVPAAAPITAGPAFDLMVRGAVIDKPWFTDAVRSEVVENMESTQTPVIRDTVVNDSTIADYITEMILEVKEENLRSRVESIIDNYIDVDDMVKDAVRDLSFTVTVD